MVEDTERQEVAVIEEFKRDDAPPESNSLDQEDVREESKPDDDTNIEEKIT